MKIRENCDCCSGTGICEDIYGNEGSCMTCNGNGYFEFEDDEFKHELAERADFYGMESLTEAEQSFLHGYIDYDQYLKESGL